MSGIRGIAKNLSAMFSSRIIILIQQIGLVPVFIHSYGKAGYGEWLAISAAVSYLGTLDFGVQTFVNQDLTVRYRKGDMEDFHVNQSTALRLLLSIVSVAALCATVVFALPMQHFLKMDGVHGDPIVPPHTVQLAIFFMAIVTLTHIVYGYFSGTFMVLGKAYVGAYWNNARLLGGILSTLVAVLFHASFATIAMAQWGTLLFCLCSMLIHLRSVGKDIFPTLKYWDRELVTKILKPSGYFALIFSCNFLAWQLPVLILQRTVGGSFVTMFSLMRTIFSMTRTILNALTQSMGPEVTSLFAMNDWKGLSKIYNYSERLIFSVIPVANVGTLYLCPFLLTIWLKQPQFFNPKVYLIGAAASIIMSTKEHKFQFQFSTNTHQQLAKFMFGTYVLLGVLWSFFIPRYGVPGLMYCWSAVELAQLIYLVGLNAKFFAHYEVLDKKYLVRLATLSVIFLAMARVFLPYTQTLPLPEQIAIAIVNGAILLLLAFPLYGLGSVWTEFQARRRGKRAA